MAFPPSTDSAPVLQPYQIWFNDLTMGVGSSGVNLKEIDGIDMSGEMRTGDAGRSREWGEWAGLDLLGGRDITVKMDISANDGGGSTVTYDSALTYDGSVTTVASTSQTATDFATALQAVAAATVPQGATESPFYVNIPAYGTLACMARPRKRSFKVDIPYTFSLAEDVQVLWHATDPRFYSTPTQLSNLTLSPIVPTGQGFPLSFPIDFGGALTPLSVTIVNEGNVDCQPIVTITGPANNPAIINTSVSGSPSLSFDFDLPDGWQIVIDMMAKTATMYSTGSTTGSSAVSYLTPGFTWWSLMPGTNVVQFTASGPSGATPSISVEWAHAWLL